MFIHKKAQKYELEFATQVLEDSYKDILKKNRGK
jgi:hypothetical protein